MKHYSTLLLLLVGLTQNYNARSQAPGPVYGLFIYKDNPGIITMEDKIISNPAYHLKLMLDTAENCKITYAVDYSLNANMTFEYDQSKRLIKKTESYASGARKFVYTYSYQTNPQGQVTEIRESVNNKNISAEQPVTLFYYDSEGRVTGMKDKDQESHIEFDNQGRVSKWNGTFTSGHSSRQEKYTYDAQGYLSSIEGTGFLKFKTNIKYNHKDSLGYKIDEFFISQDQRTSRYKKVTDAENKLISYTDYQEFSAQCFYTGQRLDSVLTIYTADYAPGKKTLEVFSYDNEGRRISEAMYVAKPIGNSFTRGALMYRFDMNYTTGTQTCLNPQGELLGPKKQVLKMKCF